jgi:hypothetical protein
MSMSVVGITWNLDGRRAARLFKIEDKGSSRSSIFNLLYSTGRILQPEADPLTIVMEPVACLNRTLNCRLFNLRIENHCDPLSSIFHPRPCLILLLSR